MALFFLLILSSFASAADEPLPALHLRSVTVSGISSGAFMATQLQVALSKRIEGSGSVAGGIYGCAEGNTAKALACMLQPEKISVPDFIEKTKVLAATNAIDPVENLEKARIFLFQSPTDKVVNPISEKS